MRLADLRPMHDQKRAGRHSEFILSHEVLNHRSGTVIAITITSQPQRAGFLI